MNMIIPFFVMYGGCPNRCIFCNVKKYGGNYPAKITKKIFQEVVDKHLLSAKKNTDRIQIAFYGGNFTGIDKNYQIELLKYAKSYIDKNLVDSVRIATRPDYIDEHDIKLLQKYHVETVEIGVQSMIDEVLNLSSRGHSSTDVRNAIEILKKGGVEVGVHLMVGLPGDTQEGFKHTVQEVIKLYPHMVRIHPTLVFEDTLLAEAYKNGKYQALAMQDAIKLCKYALIQFKKVNIDVIRIGLQTTKEMEASGSIVAGPYHPAFRALVEASIFFDMSDAVLSIANSKNKEVTFSMSPKDVSSFRGLKNQNMFALINKFGLSKINIVKNEFHERGSLILTSGNTTFRTDMYSDGF